MMAELPPPEGNGVMDAEKVDPRTPSQIMKAARLVSNISNEKRKEIWEWNKAVDAKKAEKRKRQHERRAATSA